MQAFTVEHYYQMQSYETLKQVCHVQFPAADIPNKLGKISDAPVHRVYRNFLNFVTLYLQQVSGYLNIHFGDVIVILRCNYNLVYLCIINTTFNFVLLYFWDNVNSPPHGASSGCGWSRLPADMECSCEYIE
jgi:hypothetical protein